MVCSLVGDGVDVVADSCCERTLQISTIASVSSAQYASNSPWIAALRAEQTRLAAEVEQLKALVSRLAGELGIST